MEKVTFPESINRSFRALLRECFFIKPAVITKVNDFTVDVLPLTTTKYKDGEQLKAPEAFDVPLMIYSGNKGNARITVPVKKGDTVLLLYSDRDYGDLLENKIGDSDVYPGDSIDPCSGHPIMAIPEFFTDPEGKPINKDDIVIENGTTSITIKPSGDININAPGNINVNASTANVTVSESVNITAPQQVNITTPQAFFSGVVQATEFIATTRVVAPSLQRTEGGGDFYEHNHNENDNGGPTGPPIF